MHMMCLILKIDIEMYTNQQIYKVLSRFKFEQKKLLMEIVHDNCYLQSFAPQIGLLDIKFDV